MSFIRIPFYEQCKRNLNPGFVLIESRENRSCKRDPIY